MYNYRKVERKRIESVIILYPWLVLARGQCSLCQEVEVMAQLAMTSYKTLKLGVYFVKYWHKIHHRLSEQN